MKDKDLEKEFEEYYYRRLDSFMIGVISGMFSAVLTFFILKVPLVFPNVNDVYFVTISFFIILTFIFFFIIFPWYRWMEFKTEFSKGFKQVKKNLKNESEKNKRFLLSLCLYFGIGLVIGSLMLKTIKNYFTPIWILLFIFGLFILFVYLLFKFILFKRKKA